MKPERVFDRVISDLKETKRICEDLVDSLGMISEKDAVDRRRRPSTQSQGILSVDPSSDPANR